MNIFEVTNNLYTQKDGAWIKDLDEESIEPFLIQRNLAMNDNVRVQTRWLDKYVFSLSPKMYLSLAWSVMPKADKAPFVKYIKKASDEEEFDFILSKVRHHMELSDNDFNANKSRIIAMIKQDMISWFSFYGIEKSYWKKYYLDFSRIKEFGNVINKQNGLNKWGF